ncbi:hypothetical protein FPSE5266_06221 [Fusarium pseudograminearum]|nr:hypothetical protein FPSE5266_06221 [Fusarium pseudograminearum]
MVTTRSMRSNTLAMEIDNDGSDYEMHETNDENDKSFIEDQGQDEDQDEGENFIGDDDEDGDENDDGDEYDDEDDRDEYNDQDDEDEYDDEDGDKDEDKHIGEDEGYNDCNAQQPCQKVFKDRESLLKHVRACAACPLKYKQEPVALESQLCIEHALEMVDRSAVLTPVRTAVETTLNRASTATIRQPQEALEFLSDPQRSYGGMSTEETA